jgi:hypothetical protein
VISLRACFFHFPAKDETNTGQSLRRRGSRDAFMQQITRISERKKRDGTQKAVRWFHQMSRMEEPVRQKMGSEREETGDE